MTGELCNLFEICQTLDAPLCPIREDTVKYGIWYGDEPICQAAKFQTLPWIQKQKLLSNLGMTIDDGFFTVRMLNTIRSTLINRNLKGASADDRNSELKWLKQMAAKRITASQKRWDIKTYKRKGVAKVNSAEIPTLWG